MKRFLTAFLFLFVVMGMTQVSYADKDFYGIVESRPDGKVGTWKIGGRSVEVTDMTRLDEDYAPIKVGTCVEVDIDDGMVEEIESEPPRKCRK